MKHLMFNERTEQTTESLDRTITNIDRDDEQCFTIYTKTMDGVLVYVTLTKDEMAMIANAFNIRVGQSLDNSGVIHG